MTDGHVVRNPHRHLVAPHLQCLPAAVTLTTSTMASTISRPLEALLMPKMSMARSSQSTRMNLTLKHRHGTPMMVIQIDRMQSVARLRPRARA